MKNDNYSQPYRSLGFDKIDAPAKKQENTPKSSKNAVNGLKGGGKKR